MLRGIVVGLCVVTGVALATTWEPPRLVRCPVCDTGFRVRLPKTRLVPAPGRDLRGVRQEPLFTCPSCRFSGIASDLRNPMALNEDARRRIRDYLRGAVAAKERQAVASAEIAALRRAPGSDVGRRFLEAAAEEAPGTPAWRRLAARARDAFEEAASHPSPAAAYAAGELCRQLGEAERARRWMQSVASDSRAPAHLRRWASEALGGSRARR